MGVGWAGSDRWEIAGDTGADWDGVEGGSDTSVGDMVDIVSLRAVVACAKEESGSCGGGIGLSRWRRPANPDGLAHP